MKTLHSLPRARALGLESPVLLTAPESPNLWASYSKGLGFNIYGWRELVAENIFVGGRAKNADTWLAQGLVHSQMFHESLNRCK